MSMDLGSTQYTISCISNEVKKFHDLECIRLWFRLKLRQPLLLLSCHGIYFQCLVIEWMALTMSVSPDRGVNHDLDGNGVTEQGAVILSTRQVRAHADYQFGKWDPNW